MKVVILAGGLGTRLREETEFRPKPMVNIGNRPILWHIMKTYANYGFKDFIICLGYKGNMIKEYFYNYEILNNNFTIEFGDSKNIKMHSNRSGEDWRVTLIDTGERALKGARLKKIEKYIDMEQFMVTYGDGLANIDINSLLSFHSSHGKLATVTGVNPISRFGELKIDGDNVVSFSEKPKYIHNLINGGFFIFNKGIFDYLSCNDNCDLEFGALEKVAKDGQLKVYKHKGEWVCMDTLRDMQYLNKLWREGKSFWKVWR